MAIIRLGDKYKSKYKLQLTPERTYISSSSGITGSVYVFPNRSETQKDNIDERLNLAPMVEEGTEFSGKPIRAYDSNSLEARREEIFKGELNKMIGGAFTDATQYEYKSITPTQANFNTTKVGELWNDQISAGTVTVSANDQFQRTSDNRIYERSSDGEWISYPEIFLKLPESDRDRTALKYDVALGMLLDGTHPFTEDHAWRSSYTYPGNSSFTGTPNPELYQFTGLGVFTDELGIPYLDSPVTTKEEINPWPPEIKKNNIISNWMLSGYSDLSMHPRNATKKEIVLTKADFNLFSSGSARQRVFANRIEALDAIESGWYTDNYQCLSLHKYTDMTGTDREPFLVYDATANYKIDFTDSNCQTMFEFWIKPCKEQVEPGCILQLENNYAIALIPDMSSEFNGIFERYMLAFYNNEGANSVARTIRWSTAVNDASGNPVTESQYDIRVGNVTGERFVAKKYLYLDNWHHVVIRFGRNFNNGELNVYIDGEQLPGVDGVNNISERNGIIETEQSALASAGLGNYLLVGGWGDGSNYSHLFGDYGVNQNNTTANGTSYTNGLAVTCQYQLKSELMELRCWSKVRPQKDILIDMHRSLSTTADLTLYLPFLFDPRTPDANNALKSTPQWERLGFLPNQDNPETTKEYYQEGSYLTINNANLPYNKTQFCTNSAFLVGMPFVNVHSHLRDYATGFYPIIAGYHDFSDTTTINVYPTFDNESTDTGAVAPETYIGLEYFQKYWKRLNWLQSLNSMILPCDNSLFNPKYEICHDNTHKLLTKGNLRLNGVGIGSISTEYEIKHFYDDEVFTIQETIVSSDPNKKVFKGKAEQYQTAALVADNKLEDNDFISPISTTIAVPQIYYGNRIHPGTIELSYKTVSGKTITIIDSEGTLYRKDCRQLNHTAKVGHVDYGNGLLCIFSPLLTGLGIDNFTIKLKGEKNMHVLQLDIPCDAGVANISQHPSYKKLKPSANSNETDGNVTFISVIYLHDENLNIIGKVNLAQPVMKREADSYIFRVKLDF